MEIEQYMEMEAEREIEDFIQSAGGQTLLRMAKEGAVETAKRYITEARGRDGVEAERTRCRAILTVADGSQFDLAGRLIREGVDLVSALEVLVNEQRKGGVE